MSLQSAQTEDGITTIQLTSRLLRAIGVGFVFLGGIGIVGQLQQGRLAASWIGGGLAALFFFLGLAFTFDTRKLRIHPTLRTIERIDGVWPFIARRTAVFADSSLIVAEPFPNMSKYGPSILYRVVACCAEDDKVFILVDEASHTLAMEITKECENRMACRIQFR